MRVFGGPFRRQERSPGSLESWLPLEKGRRCFKSPAPRGKREHLRKKTAFREGVEQIPRDEQGVAALPGRPREPVSPPVKISEEQKFHCGGRGGFLLRNAARAAVLSYFGGTVGSERAAVKGGARAAARAQSCGAAARLRHSRGAAALHRPLPWLASLLQSVLAGGGDSERRRENAPHPCRVHPGSSCLDPC